MKALRFYGRGDLRLEQVDEPALRSGWSVVEVEWASICGSDVKEYVGPAYLTSSNGVVIPVTLGHEFAGRLALTSGSRTDLQAGDRVAVEPAMRDGTCAYCRQDNYVLCDNLGMLGFDADGGFAERVLVPDYSLHKLPSNVPNTAGPLIEPFAVCVHAVRRGKVRASDTVAVVGAGMIGLGVLAVALSSGVEAVHVLDRSAVRRKRAMAIGATSAIDPATEINIGADIAFDCVGAGESANAAIRMTRKGGRIVLVGIFNSPPQTNLNEVVLREREMVGSFAYVNDFPSAIQLVADGRIPVDAFVSRQIGLTEAVDQGFDKLVAEPEDYVRILLQPQA